MAKTLTLVQTIAKKVTTQEKLNALNNLLGGGETAPPQNDPAHGNAGLRGYAEGMLTGRILITSDLVALGELLELDPHELLNLQHGEQVAELSAKVKPKAAKPAPTPSPRSQSPMHPRPVSDNQSSLD